MEDSKTCKDCEHFQNLDDSKGYCAYSEINVESSQEVAKCPDNGFKPKSKE